MTRRKLPEHIHWPVIATVLVGLAAVGGLVVWYEKGPGAERIAAPPGTTFHTAKDAGATITPSEPPSPLKLPGIEPAPPR
jgi:hypothetical protein